MTSTLDLFLASLVLGATSLSSRLVVWLPGLALHRALPWLQSLAVGLLLGDALLHVLPHALETGLPQHEAMGWVGLGVLALVAVESFLRPGGVEVATPGVPATFARMNLVGDFLHHFVDGIVLAAGFIAGGAAGLATLLAVALHEIPREIGSASVLVAGGYRPRDAFRLSLGMAVAVPAGALAMQWVRLDQHTTGAAMAIACGTVLYVALADILPGVWQRTVSASRWAPAIGIGAGLVFMWIVAEGGHHH